MNFGSLLFQLPPEERKVIRKIENISKKLINANFAVIFNEICSRENLLPTFTNIYIYIYIYDLIAILDNTQNT